MSKAFGVSAALSALVALLYAVFKPAQNQAQQQQAAATKSLKLDDRPYELRFKLADMVLRERPLEFASEELRLREALKELPSDAPEEATLKTALAALLLESGYASRPPDADALEEGRELADAVFRRLGTNSVSGLKLRTLLLLAEGKPEDALGPAQQLQRAIDGKQWEDKCCKWERVGAAASEEPEEIWAAYHTLAQTHLAATCAKACHAHKLELLAQHAVEGAVFAEDPIKAASSQRAGGMWRVMEAGRVYERAYKAAPSANATWNALDCHFATNRLRTLNAFQVSSTNKLFALANCDMYVGVRVEGKTCLDEGENPYDRAKKTKRKRRKKKGSDSSGGE